LQAGHTRKILISIVPGRSNQKLLQNGLLAGGDQDLAGRVDMAFLADPAWLPAT
jgi:hypothetical protein